MSEGLCFEYTNYCFGFYVTNDVDTATYYFDGLSWDAGTVSSSNPDLSAADFSGAQAAYKMDPADVNYGFHEKHFFTIASDWADLTAGALFYRF